MTEILKPQTLDQLRDALAWAVAEEARLEIVGHGGKRGWGRPMQSSHTLDVSAIAGVRLYEPEELVLTAAAGTPMSEIDTLLAARRQMLGFEPPDFSALFGAPAGNGTLGGAVACNLGGPRRVKSGAARDHFLGFTAVSGRGEEFKSGGRVVKNVTGYDLSKLIAGSFGTLAVMSEVTLKVLPAPKKTRTVLIFGVNAPRAVAALAEALNSPYEVSGAAHLPEAIARRSAVDYVRNAGAAVSAVRVEGTEASVAARCQSLRKLLAAFGAIEELHTMNSNRLWREVRDVAALLPDPRAAIWRVSLPPSEGPRVAVSLAGAESYLDWGGGLLWLAARAEGDAGAATLRAAMAGCGGHATLLRGPEPLRAAIEVFEPRRGALGDLTARIKDAFDPRRILNPGRMYAGV